MGGLTKLLPVGGKAMTVAGMIGPTVSALRRQDPAGMERSRAERLSGLAGNMLGGMLMPPLVGWVLDRSWSGALAEGVRIYDFAAYRAGFSPMLAWLALALVLLAFTRETHCRQTQ